MNTLLKLSVGLLVITGVTRAIAGDVSIAPGLWVVQHQGNMGSGGVNVPMPDAKQMQDMMKNLPPDVRAKMEKHVGANGSAIATADGAKICISPEQAAHNTIPADPSGKCKTVKQERKDNTITVSMQCEKGNMDTVITINDAKSWSSTMKGAMQHGGENMTMDMQATGKWVSQDCGTLKPFSANPQTTK